MLYYYYRWVVFAETDSLPTTPEVEGLTTFYIVRHGQTEWNRLERFRGTIDVPLNETGEAQARAVADRLASEPGIVRYRDGLYRVVSVNDTCHLI